MKFFWGWFIDRVFQMRAAVALRIEAALLPGAPPRVEVGP